MAHSAGMGDGQTGESRRYHFPPLWSVPLLLIAAIMVIFSWAWGIGPLALLPAAAVVVWLLRRADVYVRDQERDVG